MRDLIMGCARINVVQGMQRIADPIQINQAGPPHLALGRPGMHLTPRTDPYPVTQQIRKVPI